MLLLRTTVLLLCVASGMSATLGHYQPQANQEQAAAAAAVTAAAAAAAVDSHLTDEVVAAAPADAQIPDSPVSTEPKQPAKLPGVNNPAADSPEMEIPAAASVPADGPAGHPSDMETSENLAPQQPPEEDDNEIRLDQISQSRNSLLAREDDSSWSLNSIRNSFQTVHGYFDSLVELVGGRDGVCQYRCKYGEPPQPRSGYQLPEPNGCSSSLVGFQLDLGIPAMTKCCNRLDVCYDTCGTSKDDCDSGFRTCLHDICSDLEKSLGFVSKAQACESVADALYNTVWTLGCRPYMNSQRAACICKGEEKDEL